ncbi:MAG TPA: bifunctional methylenetetrahydrofolate dehydrogenase/methenyltetrahydrofolate cyclohydrolase FolD [Chitinophagales bacterium]|nr:bifunctional methylenetetrahydrofolate dehydrogenase/methenyltetrahydrofolate cyclohydrolase FolD [Chitinophagales bacterium]HQV78728.1 bifunctional methylenetetrahydrofolate dehydrogenase/methenyltetrahydrofolate cyclohydrolase FolD [Chitinophagales bacterium]HQW79094.1 bifunctional methylenetetrahydrofolate dehydrogenase/methenyltetrahydrofolate cyclohydrolase FolD [Chitinophagales bacterium]HRB69956.1 bifunctional methylenetetrahydrofolate dehydrogenase/methenyltetrahydrofolate cyclohydrol
MQLLDGKKLAAEIKLEIAEEVKKMVLSGKRAPHLAAILVGNDGASQTYVSSKVKSCEEVGFKSTLVRLKQDITQHELISQINNLNNDDAIDGFIVQLPLPRHIDEEKVILAIAPEKDVDGFHPMNVGRMTLNLPSYISATPKGILEMLNRYNIETEGKHCVVIGRSNIVGLPMSLLMQRRSKPGNCTVTICHSKTNDLAEYTLKADIIIAALGKPKFLTADMVKKGAVVIDVGITRVEDASKKSGYKLFGDVDFEMVSKKCSYISPVPGGVGLMTVASLLQNTLSAAKSEFYAKKSSLELGAF